MDRSDPTARFAPAHAADDRPARCLDRETGRPVVLDRAVDEAGGLALRLAHERLLRLAHPHVARALDAGCDPDGRWWAVREALTAPLPATVPATMPAGTPTRVEATAPPVGTVVDPADLAAWLPGWLAGLAALHAAGLVHGALGPSSLGLDAEATPRLADLGRAWRIGQIADGALPADARPFAAPEVLAEGRIDARADLYAVGALCLWWLTGAAPSGDPALRAEALAGLPAPWGELVMALLRPHPSRRPASAAEALAPLTELVVECEEGPSPLAASPLPAPARQVPALAGRRAELERLLAAADEVADVSASRILAVTGEAGAGKSRLVAELRHRLLARGWTTLVARPDGRLDGVPYGAWGTALGRLLAIASPATRAEVGPLLADALPGLEGAGDAGPTAPALEPRAAMLRLCRAIATLIEEAAAAAPLAICLEDWHAADPASRELLAYLDRALPAVPALLVVATRGDGTAGGDATPAADTVPLGPLDGGDARACWRGALGERGRGRPGAWDPALDGAGGNPGMLVALADAFAQAAPPPGKRGGGRGTAVLAELAPTRTLPALWTHRLAACSAPARALAAAAAVAGPRASLGLLGAIAPEVGVVAAAQELLAIGAVVPEAEGLTLAAPAEAALEGVEAEALRAGHARALAYWRTAAMLGAEVAPALLARHALASGDAAAGMAHATAAARAALRLHALDEASALLDGAAARSTHVPDAPAAWWLDLAEARGDLARFQAQGLAAEQAYQEALALAEAAAPEREATIRTSLGIALNLTSRGAEAGALFAAAEADARAPIDARLRATAQVARHAVRHGRPDEALAACRAVVEHPEAPARLRGEALGLIGLIHATVPGQPVEAGLASLAEATALARETGDRLAALNASMLAGNAYYALGRLGAARTSFERYALLCRELGLPDEAACATLNLAQVAFAQGRFQEAWDRARAGARAAGSIGNRIYEAFGQAYAGLAGCHVGQLAEAERALDEVAAGGPELGDHMRLQVEVVRLEALIFLGRLGRAEALGLAIAGQAAGGEFQGQHALLMGQLYELAGELEPAVAHLRAAKRAAEDAGNAALRAAVELGLGLVALRAGQLAVAEQRAGDALALADDAGARLVSLRSHLLLGRVRWSLGRPTEAADHLAAAEALARDLGSPHWQAMVWQTVSRFAEDGASLRHKAAAFMHFYLNQLPPIARQDFLRWPERRDLFSGRATQALEAIVPRAPVPPAAPKEARA